jgi:hypothetical protein
MKTRHKQLFAVVVGIGLLAAFLATRSRGEAQAAGARGDEPVASEGTTMSIDGIPVRVGGRRMPNPDEFLTSDQLQQHLDAYKQAAVYPIWSRPHDDGSKHLLHWNSVAGSQAIFDNTPGQERYFVFEADRNHVDYGDAITSWVKMKDQREKPVKFTIADAYVVITSGPRQGRYLKLDYHDDGKDGDLVAGDGVYTNRLTPADHQELSTPEQAKLVAELVIGDKMVLAERPFGYAPRPVLDVLGMTEQVENGSLAVTLDVQVHEAGGYNLQANLVAATVPVAWTDMHFKLQPGRQQVKLVFFGKAIRDVGAAGPFEVRDVRGYLSLFNPDTTLWFADAATLTTRAYRPEDFSPGEWDDDEKRARIANYEKLIAATREDELYGNAPPAKLVERDEHGVEREVPYPQDRP